MREISDYIGEDGEEVEYGEDWGFRIRHEVLEFILRRYSMLRARDIANVLGWKVREVNRALKHLEGIGRVKRMKLGKNNVWTHVNETRLNPMYF